MARIIGAVACSHTPTIGFAHDKNKQQDPVWAPIFEAFAPARRWLEDNKPDALFFIYNDHVSSFFFDHYSAFTLGVGEQHAVADEGGGARDLPALAGHPALAQHIGRSLVADEFDMSFFQDRALDHGVFSPLSLLCGHEPAWPVPVIPLQVGVLQSPVPSARRCWRLGQALRRAIESYPEDLKVAIVATGGLSHQVHGERAGFNNTAWDAQFLDLIENDPVRLTEMTQAELATLGGAEGAEVIMWLVMRGALSANIRKTHQSYYLPSMTGIATAIYENLASAPIAGEAQRHRRHMDAQLAGIEALRGHLPLHAGDQRARLPAEQVPARHDAARAPRGLPGGRGGGLRGRGTHRAGARTRAAARLARAHPPRRDLLHAGEAGRGGRRVEPAHLCGHARPDARRLPADAQRARRAVFGGRQGRRAAGLGHRRHGTEPHPLH
jgi:gallate dioxygenase